MIYDVYRRRINKIYNVYKLDVNRYPACNDKKDFSHIIYNLDQLKRESNNDLSRFFIDYECENIGYEKFSTKSIDGPAKYINGMHYKIGDKIFIDNVRYEIIGVGTDVLYVDDSNIIKEIGINEAHKLYEEINNRYGYKEIIKKENFKDKIVKFFKK